MKVAIHFQHKGVVSVDKFELEGLEFEVPDFSHGEYEYLNFGRHILENGRNKGDRTGTGTKQVFGYQMRFDLSKGFPVITTKYIHLPAIIVELLWFLKGDTNIRYLLKHNVNIWNEWALDIFIKSDDFKKIFPDFDMTDWKHRKDTDDEFKQNMYLPVLRYFKQQILEDKEFAEKYGELGNVYGAQWRRWKTSKGETIDQIKDVIQQIQKNPDSRRLIVNAWNPEDVPNSALPPCHCFFQFDVTDGKLSCQLYQRSGDFFLGIPFNITSYALLTYLIAHECGLEVGEFVHTVGDAHIYKNHISQVNEQLSRAPKASFPTLKLNKEKESVFDFELEDIVVENYEHHPKITEVGS